MSDQPFVVELRTRPGVIRLAGGGTPITLRVQVPEVWDTVAVEASPDTAIGAMKRAAVGVLLPQANPDELVLKLRGFEILNEQVSVGEAGAVDGSIFLATYRRRRPVH